MFGISWTEFLVIILVAICIVPAKNWPDIAKFLGRVVKWVRGIIWKVTNVSEQIQQRIDLEKPIDDLIENATNDIFYDTKPHRVVRKRKTTKKK